MEIVSHIPPGLHQEDPDSALSSQESSTAVEYDKIEVANIPNQADEDYLQLYFESTRSGGCDDAVNSVMMIQPGMAHVQFHDPEGIMQYGTYNIISSRK